MKKTMLALALTASVFGYVAANEEVTTEATEATETVVAQAPEVVQAPSTEFAAEANA